VNECYKLQNRTSLGNPIKRAAATIPDEVKSKATTFKAKVKENLTVHSHV
jgi:hypothetical protein